MASATLDPAGGPTYDYSDWSTAESSEEDNLVTLGETFTFTVSNSTGAGITETGNVDWGGWTMNATYYVIIEAASGYEAGLAWDSDAATIAGDSATSWHCIALGRHTAKILWKYMQLQREGVSGGVLGSTGDYETNTYSTVEFENCFLRAHQATEPVLSVLNDLDDYNSSSFHNCVIAGYFTDQAITGRWDGNWKRGEIYNTVIDNWHTGSSRGFDDSEGATKTAYEVRNTIVNHAGTPDCSASTSRTYTNRDNWYTDDGTGTGDSTGTPDWVDASGWDYHLAAADDGSFEGGDISGDSLNRYEEDMEGDSRSDWDAGPDEYVAAGPTVKSPTDVGSGSTEAVTITSALSIADTGGGTEGALGPTITLSVTDTSSGSDEPLLAVAIPVSDAGTGSDTLGFSVLALIADLIQGFDTTTISATIPVSEVGAGADEVSILGAALKLVADSASGADTLALAVSAGVVEAGTGVEALNLSAVVTVPDSATGDEALILATAAIKLVADAGAGSDAITIPTVILSVVDTGVGSDVPTIDVVLSVADTGSGNDIADVLAAILKSVADTGGGTEALSVNVSAEVPDAAVGSDALSIGALVAVIEAAGGADVVTKTEPGTGVRSIEFTLSGKSVVFTLAAKSTTFTLQ